MEQAQSQEWKTHYYERATKQEREYEVLKQLYKES